MIVWGIDHIISQESLADLSYLLVNVYCFVNRICRDRNTLRKRICFINTKYQIHIKYGYDKILPLNKDVANILFRRFQLQIIRRLVRSLEIRYIIRIVEFLKSTIKQWKPHDSTHLTLNVGQPKGTCKIFFNLYWCFSVWNFIFIADWFEGKAQSPT